jgi:hypothetical protein
MGLLMAWRKRLESVVKQMSKNAGYFSRRNISRYIEQQIQTSPPPLIWVGFCLCWCTCYDVIIYCILNDAEIETYGTYNIVIKINLLLLGSLVAALNASLLNLQNYKGNG